MSILNWSRFEFKSAIDLSQRPADHDRITPFDEKLHAGPVSLLWQGV
jgi:hypothetical protein